MKTKRFYIAVALLTLILLLCSVATWDLHHQLTGLQQSLHTLGATAPSEQQSLVEQSRALTQQWDEAESRFVLYVSHDSLDHLTQMIAELPALAQHAEYSHLYSHVDAIAALLDDLWEASIPSYRTLL